MKFGEIFLEYRQAEEGSDKFCPHVECKRLKKVLKSCRACKAAALKESDSNGQRHVIIKLLQHASLNLVNVPFSFPSLPNYFHYLHLQFLYPSFYCCSYFGLFYSLFIPKTPIKKNEYVYIC